MPRVGRKASSLILFGLLSAMAIIAAFGNAVAQDAELPEGAVAVRTVTIGVIDAGCPGGAPEPCWDTNFVIVRPGETLNLIADLRTSAGFHNIHVLEGEDTVEGGGPTQQGPNLYHEVNVTIPADYESGSWTYICDVHPDQMVGEIVTPEGFAASGGGGAPIHHMGVHFLAYWVGLIAFAILFLTYGITFFLFKYNETTATTDQWDRTGAGAPDVKNKMSSGNATLLAIVIAIVALAAIIYLARMG